VQDQAKAWAALATNGERSMHTTSDRPGEDLSLTTKDTGPATALEFAALAVAVDLLTAFEHEASISGVSWTGVEVNVDLERGDRPPRIVRVDYQIRVATDDAVPAQIASHQLEAHAPVFASLVVGAEHTGHVVSASAGPV